MVRTIIAAFVGAFIIVVWGMIAWPIFNLWGGHLHSMPGNGAVIERALQEGIPSDGAYYFPGIETEDWSDQEKADAWTKRYEAGPVGMVLIRKGGQKVDMVTSLLAGFTFALFAGFMVAGVQSYVGSLGASYGARALVGLCFSVFAVLATFTVQWNWFWFPCEFVSALAADTVIAWVMATLVMAKIVGRTVVPAG